MSLRPCYSRQVSVAGTILSLVGIRRCYVNVSRSPYCSYSSKHLFLLDLATVISLKGDSLPKGRKCVLLNCSKVWYY